MKTLAISFLLILMGCANSADKPVASQENSESTIEEVSVENPNKKSIEPEKKIVTIHHSGISAIDVIEFASEQYIESQIVEEQMKTTKEDEKKYLPSGARVNNP